MDDITAPGGLRALPDAADLRRFVDTASNMDGLRIAELLREKMVGGTAGLAKFQGKGAGQGLFFF